MNTKTPNNNIFQNPGNSQLNQEKPTNIKKNSLEVRQDGRASRSGGVASFYAERVRTPRDRAGLNKQNKRPKKHSTRRQTVQGIGWFLKPISLQIDKLAREMRITRSKAIVYLVELGLANNILRTHMKVIIDTLAHVLKEQTRRYLLPYRDNSYRAAFYCAQDRVLLTNVLNLMCKLLVEPPGTAQRIVRKSEEEARDALKILTPQLADLIKNQEHRYGIWQGEQRQEEE